MVMIGIAVPVSGSCDWKNTVMVSPTFAYPVFVPLFELNAVEPVMRYGVSLSICMITELFVASVLPNLSME